MVLHGWGWNFDGDFLRPPEPPVNAFKWRFGGRQDDPIIEIVVRWIRDAMRSVRWFDVGNQVATEFMKFGFRLREIDRCHADRIFILRGGDWRCRVP